MVSNHKRSRCISISESTTDEDSRDMEYIPNSQPKKSGRKPTRTPKCFTKNALMARENRLKKKVYISNLEEQVSSLQNENKKLSAVVDNQSFMIEELKKEVKYLKSVISNSKDIGKLIRAINTSTGMAVTTSLDRKLTDDTKRVEDNNSLVTQVPPDANMWGQSKSPIKEYIGEYPSNKHPWEERNKAYISYPTPDSTNSYYSNPDFDELNNDGLLLDMDIPLNMNNDELLEILDEEVLESRMDPVEEHNYHNPVKYEVDFTQNEDDVGVCLHVSKNKVSLEFCPSCSDNALQNNSLIT